MNKNNFFGGRARLWASSAFLGVLTGCTTYVQAPPPPVYATQPPPMVVRETVVAPPPQVEVQMPAPAVVEIRTEQDFYEPLRSYGHWIVVAEYGRCWVPDRVERDWRPYTNGHWQHTEAGWYWVSDEPWGWATYHYGRWDWRPEFGWVWVPQTQWAPAWVSFHQGGGYLGWAPLHPSARIRGGDLERPERPDRERGMVYVEERRFLEPVRPATVVVNNTTIINQTVNITSIKVVNNTVINEGPRVAVVEKASGRKIETVPVREVRHKQEAAVAAAHPLPSVHQNVTPPTERPVNVSRDHSVQAETDRRAAQAEAQAQQKARAAELQAAQVESQRRINATNAQVQAEAQRKAKEAELNAAQAEAQHRANAANAQAQAEAQRKVKEAEAKAAQAEAQHRVNLQAQAEAQRKAQEAELKAKAVAAPHPIPATKPAAETPKPIAPHGEDPVTARIAAAFAANPALRGLHVARVNGLVHLSGNVASVNEKKAAGDLAQKMDPAHPVQNNLTVRQ